MKILSEMGYTTFSCDDIYQEVTLREDYILEIGKRFPLVVVNGRIDRGKLSQIIFNDEKSRRELNQISHPLIMQELLTRMEKVEDSFVFAEVPLLFEGNFQNLFDAVIVITRQKEKRIASILQRDGGTRETIVKKMSAQWNYDGEQEFPTERAILLSNDGSEKDLFVKMQEVLTSLS